MTKWKQYKEIVERERNEPVFIRNVKKANAAIDPPIKESLFVEPANGNSFTLNHFNFKKNP